MRAAVVRTNTDQGAGLPETVQIAQAARRIDMYPYAFAGGMHLGVRVAMALLCEPQELIADEPTTACDMTVQAQSRLGAVATSPPRTADPCRWSWCRSERRQRAAVAHAFRFDLFATKCRHCRSS